MGTTSTSPCLSTRCPSFFTPSTPTEHLVDLIFLGSDNTWWHMSRAPYYRPYTVPSYLCITRLLTVCVFYFYLLTMLRTGWPRVSVHPLRLIISLRTTILYPTVPCKLHEISHVPILDSWVESLPSAFWSLFLHCESTLTFLLISPQVYSTSSVRYHVHLLRTPGDDHLRWFLGLYCHTLVRSLIHSVSCPEILSYSISRDQPCIIQQSHTTVFLTDDLMISVKSCLNSPRALHFWCQIYLPLYNYIQY